MATDATASRLGAVRLRQLCLAAPELEPAVRVLQAQLGLSVAYRDPNLIRFGLENAMLPIGPHQFIEVVAPVQPNTAVHRFLARGQGQAPGAYMLILDCEHPAAARDVAAEQGVRVIHESRYAHYHGVQLHPRDVGATMLEFCRTTGGEALDGPYHPAGPDWQRHVVNNGIGGMAQVRVHCADVATLPQRWSAIMGVPLAGDPPRNSKLTLPLGQLVFESGWVDSVDEVRLAARQPVDFQLAGVRFVAV